MIFLTQSLFVFSQDLLADMLIFLTRCSNFFFFMCVAGFGLSVAGFALRVAGRGARRRGPPL